MGISKSGIWTILSVILSIICSQIFFPLALSQTKPWNIQVQSGQAPVVPMLSLDVLSEAVSTAQVIAGFRKDNITEERTNISVPDLTKLAFSSKSATTNKFNASMILEADEIMETLWKNLRHPSNNNKTKVMWLVDLEGDSFARGQYEHLEKIVRGKRPFQDDTIFGNFRQTYHNHHIFCCPSNINATCTLRLQKFSFRGGNIHDQIQMQAANFDKNTEAPNGVICISWQWSKLANNLGFDHLKRHTETPLAPTVMVMNQGLHCAFRANWSEFCTQEYLDTMANITKDIFQSRGIKFVFDTSPAVFQKGNTSELNAGIATMNDARKMHFASASVNTGSNAHVWLRNIESLSKAFHKNPDCVKEDGVHIICNFFDEIAAVWLLNYAVGNLILNPSDPSTLLLPHTIIDK